MLEKMPPIPESEVVQQHTQASSWYRYTRRALAVGALVIGGAVPAVAGEIATTIKPARGTIDGINTETSLDLGHTNKVSVDTGFGEASASFDSPFSVLSPGINVSTELTAEAANKISDMESMVSDFSAHQQEAEDFASDQLKQLMGTYFKYSLGTMGALALAGGLSGAYRSKDRSNIKNGVKVGATFAAAGLVGVASVPFLASQVYKPGNYDQLSLTDILGRVQNTPNALKVTGDKRVKESIPYLQGWLAMGNLAQQQLAQPAPKTEGNTTAEAGAGQGPKLLLISDVHGNNLTNLTKYIIKNEDINAVINTGDIENFGYTKELTTTGIIKGIKSLNVPYFFVGGNHDRHSSTDTSLIKLMQSTPNVHVLQPVDNHDQPDQDVYNKYKFDGLNIIGMNDSPHWYGDDGDFDPKKETPYVNEFNATMASQGQADIAMSHEPDAVNQFAKGLSLMYLNGHTHQYANKLTNDSDHLTIGSLGGGDPLRNQTQWLSKQKGIHACLAKTKDGFKCIYPGWQNSFSILSYDKKCNPLSILTFQWALDASGNLIDNKTTTVKLSLKAPGKNRDCTVNGSLSEQTIKAVPTEKVNGLNKPVKETPKSTASPTKSSNKNTDLAGKGQASPTIPAKTAPKPTPTKSLSLSEYQKYIDAQKQSSPKSTPIAPGISQPTR